MRLQVSCALLIAGLTSSASADRVADSYDTRPKDNGDFWQNVSDPHGEEIQMVIDKISMALSQVDQFNGQDSDIDGVIRGKLIDDARGMAKYLRRLAPDDPRVLQALGKACDYAGRADEALEAYLAYLQQSPEDYDATMRVGRIYLRMKQYDDAIRYLRIANVNGSYYSNTGAIPSIYLADALTASGNEEEAIDVLEDSVERAGPYGGDPYVSIFALAVAYDRDEQISRAFEQLDRLQNSLQTSYISSMQSYIDQMDPAPTSEIHYYRGLLYESGGYFDEARAEWVLYADSDARYRDRALSHVAAIDKITGQMLEARKPGKKGAAAAAAQLQLQYQQYQSQYGYGGQYGQYGYGGYPQYNPPPPQPTTQTKKHHKKKRKAKNP